MPWHTPPSWPSQDLAESQLVLRAPVVDSGSLGLVHALREAAAVDQQLASAEAAAKKRNPCLEAARDGDLAELRRLVNEEGLDAKSAADKHGCTALMWAAGHGHLDIVRYLVDECGAAPDQRQTTFGRNALHWSARNGNLVVAQWLQQRGGLDVDALTDDGSTAFHFAAWQGHREVCTWLMDQGADHLRLNGFGCNGKSKSDTIAHTRHLPMPPVTCHLPTTRPSPAAHRPPLATHQLFSSALSRATCRCVSGWKSAALMCSSSTTMATARCTKPQ
mmetsp:Transcript_99699/g.285032  ORF Transcript_99699/g.285032 Transcript_99699/m.285032 type:complete len:276 (-) Transcript_99699:535-1362(-)